MNPNKLTFLYDKRQKDFVCNYPRPADGSLIFYLFGDILRFDIHKYGKQVPYEVFNVKEELEKRGYDLSTLRFSIELKEPIHELNQQ